MLRAELRRLFRWLKVLKARNITGLFTSLTPSAASSVEQTAVGISSLMDTWLLLRDFELAGERNRGIYVLKSRGMAHSNQVREFLLTGHGVELVDVCLGGDGVLVGSARRAQEARERLDAAAREQDAGRRRRELEAKRQAMEARIASLRAEFDMEQEQLERLLEDDVAGRERPARDRAEVSRARQPGVAANPPGPRSNR